MFTLNLNVNWHDLSLASKWPSFKDVCAIQVLLELRLLSPVMRENRPFSSSVRVDDKL